MLWHDDFFTLQDGQKTQSFRMGSFQGRIIIQHPFFHFGSAFFVETEEEYTPVPEIYFLQTEIVTERKALDIASFLSSAEKKHNLPSDHFLWYETGFWSLVLNKEMHMGVGLQSLFSILGGLKSSEFAFCLSNNVSVVIINAEATYRKTLLSIYASNDILPYAEVVEPYRQAIEELEDVRYTESKIIPEGKLRRFWVSPRPTSIDAVAFLMQKKRKMLPIVRNKFMRTRDPIIGKMGFLIGTHLGGFIESDFREGKRFIVTAEIWDLASVSVAEVVFRPILDGRRRPPLIL